MYGQYDKSIAQKTIIVVLEIILLWLSWRILFQHGGDAILGWFGSENVNGGIERRIIVFSFSVIVFLRITFAMFFFVRRKIPWEESMSIPFAFALYYIGFALFVLTAGRPPDLIDYAGILIFLFGSFLNTSSELQRHRWKKNPENKGKLYTEGLFRYSMHINYFGDLLWVTGYAIITRNLFSFIIPVFLFCFFVFFNIPKLDEHLKSKYGDQFEEWRKRTKRFIPFVY